jgi:hypothetical protein
VGDDQRWGVVNRRKGAANTLAALKSIRKARPDDGPICSSTLRTFVIAGSNHPNHPARRSTWTRRRRPTPSA